jgi:hypothetical protein
MAHAFHQMGLPYPPASERQAALEDTLQIVRRKSFAANRSPLLLGETVDYTGRHFQAHGATLNPPAL